MTRTAPVYTVRWSSQIGRSPNRSGQSGNVGGIDGAGSSANADDGSNTSCGTKLTTTGGSSSSSIAALAAFVAAAVAWWRR